MEISIKQARAIKNIIAIQVYGVGTMTNGLQAESITKDPEAWKHCDIQQRQNLIDLIAEFRKI